MSATSDDFFKAGLTHYGTAVETVENFKEVAHARLIGLIDGRAWKRIKLDADWREEAANYQKQAPIYVSVSVGCRFEKEASSLELGLWWNREAAASLELYVGLHPGKAPSWRRNIAATQPGTMRVVGSTSNLLRACTADTLQAVADALLHEFEDAALAAFRG